MSVTIAKWTLDEYHRMIEVGLLHDRQVELLNGDIIEMSPEAEPHAHYAAAARDYLTTLLGDRVTIRQAQPITIPASASEPVPDVAIVQPLGQEYLKHHPYPENIFWLIEFSHTSLSKDIEVKRRAYAAANIGEYWVMDLKNQDLKVFRTPIEGDYRLELVRPTGELCPLSFPDVAVSVQRLLAG